MLLCCYNIAIVRFDEYLNCNKFIGTSCYEVTSYLLVGIKTYKIKAIHIINLPDLNYLVS